MVVISDLKASIAGHQECLAPPTGFAYACGILVHPAECFRDYDFGFEGVGLGCRVCSYRVSGFTGLQLQGNEICRTSRTH